MSFVTCHMFDLNRQATRILWGQHFSGKDQGEHQKASIVQHHLGKLANWKTTWGRSGHGIKNGISRGRQRNKEWDLHKIWVVNEIRVVDHNMIFATWSVKCGSWPKTCQTIKFRRDQGRNLPDLCASSPSDQCFFLILPKYPMCTSQSTTFQRIFLTSSHWKCASTCPIPLPSKKCKCHNVNMSQAPKVLARHCFPADFLGYVTVTDLRKPSSHRSEAETRAANILWACNNATSKSPSQIWHGESKLRMLICWCFNPSEAESPTFNHGKIDLRKTYKCKQQKQ